MHLIAGADPAEFRYHAHGNRVVTFDSDGRGDIHGLSRRDCRRQDRLPGPAKRSLRRAGGRGPGLAGLLEAGLDGVQDLKEPNSDLGKVMTGRALGLFNGYVDKLKLEGRHLEGSTTFWVDSISVSDGTATGCGRLVDFSHEVDDVTGESKEPINPRVRVMSATFVKSGDLWRISSSTKGGC